MRGTSYKMVSNYYTGGETVNGASVQLACCSIHFADQ